MTQTGETVLEVEIDPAHYRSVLGNYPTGVCVITGCDHNGLASGLVVGSFTSVSLDPPMVAFFPDRKSGSWPQVRACGHFCVNVLGEDQLDLCRQFASKGGNKFAGVAYRLSDRGMPLLDNAVAHVECRIESETDAGDHTIVLGRVLSLAAERNVGPLLFTKGTYGRFDGLD